MPCGLVLYYVDVGTNSPRGGIKVHQNVLQEPECVLWNMPAIRWGWLWCYGGVGNTITSRIPNDSSLHYSYLLAMHIVISLVEKKSHVYLTRQRWHYLLQGAKWFAGGSGEYKRKFTR